MRNGNPEFGYRAVNQFTHYQARKYEAGWLWQSGEDFGLWIGLLLVGHGRCHVKGGQRWIPPPKDVPPGLAGADDQGRLLLRRGAPVHVSGRPWAFPRA
eukprot:2980737-Pyramimonas_sp.AAC.1